MAKIIYPRLPDFIRLPPKSLRKPTKGFVRLTLNLRARLLKAKNTAMTLQFYTSLFGEDLWRVR
ncbi:hypothetical protein A2V56_01765 [Candidatus Woesebacteria bacterium RBG_19FT_COMBO_42_9]|nr:MAG: hypothetical protein A2V56_01765 [Candidatus Woesebacteria bacterium RBG_19FT_COMBO_42_9]